MVHVSHIAAFKVGVGALLVAGAALAMDPTIKVALIMSGPVTLIGIGTLTLGFLTRRDSKRMQDKQDKMQSDQAKLKDSMNGHFDKLMTEREQVGKELGIAKDQLINTAKDLAHAEGVKEGSDSERSKGTP